MKTLTLDIADDFIEKFTNVLDALPAGKVTLHEVTLQKDTITTKISKRISAIEDGSEELTPYDQGMDRLQKNM